MTPSWCMILPASFSNARSIRFRMNLTRIRTMISAATPRGISTPMKKLSNWLSFRERKTLTNADTMVTLNT